MLCGAGEGLREQHSKVWKGCRVYVEDETAVILANTAFYAAFEERNFDTMSDLWEHSDRVTCTHPGWSTLHGWAKVSASWVALLQNPQHLQFILTNEHVGVFEGGAWVTCDENLLDGPSNNTVAAMNLFVRDASSRHGWRIVAHHGSVVHASA
jgi:SnoaL-like domain